MRDLARWLFRQLEREWTFLHSDEVVDEAILAAGHIFTAGGERLD